MDVESSRRAYAAATKAAARAARFNLALQDIIVAADAHPEPIHSRVREAIERARRVLEGGPPP